MILSYRAGRYSHLDTLNSKIHPLFQILDTGPGRCNNSRGGAGRAGEGAGGGAVHLTCRMGLKKEPILKQKGGMEWSTIGLRDY